MPVHGGMCGTLPFEEALTPSLSHPRARANTEAALPPDWMHCHETHHRTKESQAGAPAACGQRPADAGRQRLPHPVGQCQPRPRSQYRQTRRQAARADDGVEYDVGGHRLDEIDHRGGTGVHSFLKTQPEELPEHLEAGTLNGHGIAGLLAGVQEIQKITAEEIWKKERNLMECFVAKIKQIPNVKIYGNFSDKKKSSLLKCSSLFSIPVSTDFVSTSALNDLNFFISISSL